MYTLGVVAEDGGYRSVENCGVYNTAKVLPSAEMAVAAGPSTCTELVLIVCLMNQLGFDGGGGVASVPRQRKISATHAQQARRPLLYPDAIMQR